MRSVEHRRAAAARGNGAGGQGVDVLAALAVEQTSLPIVAALARNDRSWHMMVTFPLGSAPDVADDPAIGRRTLVDDLAFGRIVVLVGLT